MAALISFNVGGAIRLVDARGKDAEPLSILAQDNMLHIDNTPFNEEYKIILTWEKGQPSGPKGQNFVILPGTQKGVRNCQTELIDGQPVVFSTENASIFITEESIKNVFAFQGKALNTTQPQVVEVHDDNHPLSTIFQSGGLVHHRYRTAEGYSRSCMILAFHRAHDNPGQFIAATHLHDIEGLNPLNYFLFGPQHTEGHDEKFIDAIEANASIIATKIKNVQSSENQKTIKISYDTRTMAEFEFGHWKKTATAAPIVEHYKQTALAFEPQKNFDQAELLQYVSEVLMPYDKHGPLDLILYSDSHEEIRKWARNRIREMNLDDLKNRMRSMWKPTMDAMQEPSVEKLMSPQQLKKTCDLMAAYIGKLSFEEREKGYLNTVEKISLIDAHRSLQQLFTDLGETIVRCDCRQAFLSTSLFIFLACDELMRLRNEQACTNKVKAVAASLLHNYLSTFVLCQMHLMKSLDYTPVSADSSKAINHTSMNNSDEKETDLYSNQCKSIF
jgi:hypothetical protein